MEYVHKSVFTFYPSFRVPRTLSHCKYKPFIISIRILVISLKMLVKLSVTNTISDILYSSKKNIKMRTNKYV